MCEYTLYLIDYFVCVYVSVLFYPNKSMYSRNPKFVVKLVSNRLTQYRREIPVVTTGVGWCSSTESKLYQGLDTNVGLRVGTLVCLQFVQTELGVSICK